MHWVSKVLAWSWRYTQSSGGSYKATWAHWALPQVDTSIKPTKQLSSHHTAIFYTQNFWNKYFFQTKSICLMWQVLRNSGDLVQTFGDKVQTWRYRKGKRRKTYEVVTFWKLFLICASQGEPNTTCYKETVSGCGTFPRLLCKKLWIKAAKDCVNMIHNNT